MAATINTKHLMYPTKQGSEATNLCVWPRSAEIVKQHLYSVESEAITMEIYDDCPWRKMIRNNGT